MSEESKSAGKEYDEKKTGAALNFCNKVFIKGLSTQISTDKPFEVILDGQIVTIKNLKLKDGYTKVITAIQNVMIYQK